MIKLGLIGYPLGHSLSPLMHKAALAEEGIPGDYVLFETAPEELKDRVDYLKNNNFRGFNVTIPHKVAIMEYLDKIDNFALKVGAVNTVIIDENKKLFGYNTDVYGFIHAIPTDIRHNLNNKNAAIIGSGGATRAIIEGMTALGIKEVKIFTLESELEKAKELGVNCFVLNEKVNLEGISLVVNATPVGMEGKFEGVSSLSQYSLDSLPQDALVYDIVYKPRKTKLMEMAEARNLTTLGGLEMLVLQGARAFHLWTGLEASVDTMRAAIL
ncbi:MAG: shikimate dehydrogenase [Candidatus Melainabacteria bacterium GWF2_37_15]|nr:MAG: shikimate dehydrogenase [Candidatus Melainabacteria bacterium GWF2_37_15]